MIKGNWLGALLVLLMFGATPALAQTAVASARCAAARVWRQAAPVTVTLLQGGQNKLPAPSYQDNLIVTITPLLDPQSGVTCGAP